MSEPIHRNALQAWEKNMLIHKHVMHASGGVPDYTTDMRIAWQIVQYLSKSKQQHPDGIPLFYAFTLKLRDLLVGRDTPMVTIWQYDVFPKLTPDLICKAALLTVGEVIADE